MREKWPTWHLRLHLAEGGGEYQSTGGSGEGDDDGDGKDDDDDDDIGDDCDIKDDIDGDSMWMSEE